MKKKPGHADFLFAKPYVIKGIGRFLDLSGTFDEYNASPTEADADAKAAYSDWAAVGEVIRAQLESVGFGSPDDSADEAA